VREKQNVCEVFFFLYVRKKIFFCEKKISTKNLEKFFFLTYVDLYTKMCKIKFYETFRMNVGLPDLLKKSYLRKNVLFREFKSLRSHKTKTLIEKSETKLF